MGTGATGTRYGLVRVTGGCMEPRIPVGSWATVDRERAAVPDDVVLLRRKRDGGQSVKRVVEIGGVLHVVAARARSGPIALALYGVIEGVVVAVTHAP